ncbi:hypothetical protein [Acinetobacter bereziniae]|uniref:hypothetical protein n=2 Tax=Acinetobacter bereziniae TaxID=106648 RepID=UPI0018FF15A2|nr:hypothetical protein [Acinetobacter bereziniae]MBJ9903667.1 hypothetical protein [Acinetobacter bereziniae]MCU4320153.1 hypothetical protein [Acinetobacter bereziniae]MCU4599032.1 hypothetical protein [Acinetobacter bereziniae]
MYINGRQAVYSFLFFIVVFIVTRQVPFSDYSLIANIAVLILVFGMVSYDRLNIINICLVALWLCVLVQYSLFRGNEYSLILHFMLAILLLITSNFVENVPKKILKIFFILISIQCIFLIIMEVVLNTYYTQSSYLVLREYFSDKGWGDLYTYNGYFYRVQVKGNALIPVAFYLTFIKEVQQYIKYIKIHRVLAFIGICIAGNFAFWISTALFIVGYSLIFGKNKILKIITIFSAFILMSGLLLDYVLEVLSRKGESLGTRGDQYNVLISNLTNSISNFIFGNGLGSTLSVRTSFRDYTGDIYFELQGIYYFFQLGILNAIIFFGLMCYFAIKKIYYKDLLFIYGVYVSYAVSNPYFLDTNHIVLIIVLRLIYEFRKENRLYNSFI